LGNRLFIPALAIPFVTVLGNPALSKRSRSTATRLWILSRWTVISLAIATLIALATGNDHAQAAAISSDQGSTRLLDAVGWQRLPQMLAALGALFAIGGRWQTSCPVWRSAGSARQPIRRRNDICHRYGRVHNDHGQRVAAFPVMTAGIGLPLIVQKFGGDPTVMAAIECCPDFCGTLMTPMAANFISFQTALLELPDENAVDQSQIPTSADAARATSC